MQKWKKPLSMVIAGAIAFQSCSLPVFAEKTQQQAETDKAQVATVDITSDVWETPLIPDAAKTITGIGQTEISLNDTKGDGTWKYLYDIPDYTQPDGVPAPDAENQDFDFAKWSDKEWNNIKVPGEPLMQGFNIETNNEYYYQREITVPKDFRGNRVIVRFDGVYSNARVWINGKYLRTHVGGFTTWDCDITQYVKPGETVTMTVGVAELYASTKGIWNPEGKQVNNPANATEYAHHNMGGINRDVSLIALPFDNIARTHINTDFDESFTNANLEVTAQLAMLTDEAELQVELLDGETVVTSGNIGFTRDTSDLKNLPELVEEANELLKANSDNLYEGNSGKEGQYSKEAYENMRRERDEALQLLAKSTELSEAKRITLPVETPKQWDAEHPNLYTLRTTLAVGGETVQVNEEKFGFREIQYGGLNDTDKNKVYVNGKEVKLRGTCRHDVSDDLGRSMTREESYKEIEAYKKANINHIRTSHYPASEDLLDACDEMGIYVEQETAVCFQGPWADVSSKYEDFGPQFTEMIERDRNRASILIWSLGNESNYDKVKNQSGGDAFGDERAYLEDVDRTRPCIFSFPDTGEPAGFVDIYSAHYASVTGNVGRTDKPVLHDEYAHIACYNLDELQRDVNVRNFWGESIKKGWENIFTSDGALGGALWGGIDDVFYIPDGTQERWQSHSDGQTAGYGEWGSVLDAYLREKPESYLTKKAYSPVRVQEDECYVTDGTMNIPVKNWFDHTNMNELEVEYSADGGETKRIPVEADILPHSEGVITIDGVSGDAKKVNLKFYTPDGIMADEYNVELGAISYNFIPASDTPPAVTGADAGEIVVSSDNFAVTFDKTTGLISNAVFDEETLVTGGPYLHVTGMSFGEWQLAQTDGITCEIQDNIAVVTINGQYQNGQGVRFDVKISGNGIITTDYTLTTPPATANGLREVGIKFDIPKTVHSVSWLRDGLYTAYPEDHIGRNEGVALKERENANAVPDQYGVEPQWPWKDDMKNYFVYATDDPNNGIVTNDFKTMRENIWYYDVNFGTEETSPRISVESSDASVAARVDISYDLGYIDDRDAQIKYTGEWGTYEASSDYAGTEHFSTRIGDACELTFEGTGVRFIGAKQKNTGLVDVFIDGNKMEQIDTYSDLGSDLKQAVIYSIDGLENGTHTIRLETAGGNANCFVVDAFEVLSAEGSQATEEAKLVIDNQWYYPNLGWGNYFGIPGTLSNGTQGSATIRLTNQKNFSAEVIPSVKNVTVTEEENKQLKVSYDLHNASADMTAELQWYRVRVGDPDSKAEAIADANSETLDSSALDGNKVYCTVTLKNGETVLATAKSNTVEIGASLYQYFDITADSELFTFEGTEGKDYKTDKDMAWTANAYGKTVTYLLPTQNKASMTFTFTGSAVRWVGAKENNQGIAEVIIDEGTLEEVDLFDANSSTGVQVSEVLFEKVWDKAEQHTITINRTGRKNPESSAANVSLDAIIVINKDGLTVTAEEEAAQPETEEPVQPETEEAGQSETTEEPGEVPAIGTVLKNIAATVTGLETVHAASIESTEIEAAIQGLSKAIADFKASKTEKEEVDKTKLEELVKEVDGTYEESLYTEESWKAFAEVLKAAKELLKEADATKEEVDAKYDALKKATDGLVEVSVNPVDKTKLEELVKEVDGTYEESLYTEESWKAFAEALKAAKELLKEADATKEEVDAKYDALKKARDGLVKVSKDLTEDKTNGNWMQNDKGWWYSYEDGSYPTNQWKMIDGIWYAFDQEGYMRTGWFLDGTTWYYLNESGAMQSGWVLAGGTWYYLNESGAMQSGWVLAGGTWYYLNESGAMQTGWVLAGGTWYYLNESGAMQTGWILAGGSWYYLNESGAMQSGWILLGSTWYYLNESGAMQTGWMQDGNKWYYLNKNGDMATGWIYNDVSGSWYYLNENGVMAERTWIDKYYVNSTGAWSTTR